MTQHLNENDDRATPQSASGSVTPEPASQPAKEILFKIDAKDLRNIKFIGRPEFSPGKTKILKDPQPIESYSDSGRVVNLPPGDWQKKHRLFYHERAGEIARLFPNLYKVIVRK